MSERLRHFQELATAHNEVSEAMIALYQGADATEKLEMDKIIYSLTWREFAIACA